MAKLTVAGLFAGIGGIERGLELAGHRITFLCEIEDRAQRVLERRFPTSTLAKDVRELKHLPSVDVVAAGFPCQDLSQAGRTFGIDGPASGLVSELFRLLDRTPRNWPRWLVLENVPFMLHLERGQAMRFLTAELERRRFRWAYRVIDTRAFGLPHRRRRVILVASRVEDPRNVLLVDDGCEGVPTAPGRRACGFYWTEGNTGVGWAIDAIPTLKGSSGLDIPSPPAIWLPMGTIVTPDIRDGERLQGFPPGWTAPAAQRKRRKDLGARWRLLGNAVSVPVARWLGRRLDSPKSYDETKDEPMDRAAPWPNAAWNVDGRIHRASASSWPVKKPYRHLVNFLLFPSSPLSARATGGFLTRARLSTLRFQQGFLEAVAHHLAVMERAKREG